MPDFLFNSLGLKVTVKEVVQEIISFMRADENRQYKVTIGTDSQLLSGQRQGNPGRASGTARHENSREAGQADFVTAVVVHRIGNGGKYFWHRMPKEKMHTLRERIIKEVLISVEIAKGVLGELKKFELPKFDFEIHIDVGENGPTKQLISDVVSIVRANNFEAKTKPESYAATNVADRHV